MEASLRPRSAPSTRPILLSCTHGVRRTTWISNPVLFNVLCLKPGTAYLVKSKASRQRITKNLNDIPHPGRIRMPEVEHHIELVLINDRELYSATIRNVVLSTTSVLKVRTFFNRDNSTASSASFRAFISQVWRSIAGNTRHLQLALFLS